METFIDNQFGKILTDQITTTNKVKRVGNFVGRLALYVLSISTE